MTHTDPGEDFEAEVRAAVRFERTMALRGTIALAMCGLVVALHQLLS